MRRVTSVVRPDFCTEFRVADRRVAALLPDVDPEFEDDDEVFDPAWVDGADPADDGDAEIDDSDVWPVDDDEGYDDPFPPAWLPDDEEDD